MLQTPEVLRNTWQAAKSLGDKKISSDAIFVPDGFADMFLLFKEFPSPVLSTGEGVECALPFGLASYQPSQLKCNQQSQVSIADTTRESVENFITQVTLNGGRFNAWIYEGSREKYNKAYFLEDCSLALEPPSRDTEARTQALYVSGTLFYHYFGIKDKKGNI